jgi:hypothetical protein
MAVRLVTGPTDSRAERLGERADFADWVTEVTSAVEERRAGASGVPMRRRRVVSTPSRWLRATRDRLGSLALR